jgi:LmbE family N-acetylglucosaminyl deacetylase
MIAKPGKNKIYFAFCNLLLLVGLPGLSYAQQVRPATSEKIYQEITQLQHLVNVLYVAAHPDDENTRLLAWLINEQHIRTGYLSLTRGDGGQNILGSEQGEALGLIRTHELLEARKIDGAEQLFSRAIDFGFSKIYQETFKHWPQYLLTYDAVWMMRKFRPDVVICRFPPDTLAGHGQHAASAIIAASAFKKAGDKLQYTEQLHYYPAWQPKRLLWNTYRFGDRNTTSETQFKLVVGQYLPGLGMGVGELAGQSRSVHKSQGAGTPSVPGVQTEYFKLVDGDTLSQSLFDGIDITWGRVGRPDIGTDLRQIEQQFDFKNPAASMPALLAVRNKIITVKDDFWRTQKMDEINRAILDCSGLMAELYAKQPQSVAGATLPFTLHVIARSQAPVILSAIHWGSADTAMNFTLPHDTLVTFEHAISIPSAEPVTQPYWLSQPHVENDMFTIPHDTLLGLPETPGHLNATLSLKIAGSDFTVDVPLSYKKLDPVKGDIVEQLRIVPGAAVAFNTSLLITQPDGSVQADVRLHAYKEIKDAALTISGRSAAATVGNITLSAGTDTIIPVHIKAELASAQGKGDFYLSAELTAGGKVYNLSQHLIQYNHIPTLQYFTQPFAKVLRANWKYTAKRIGYIEGAGDYIPSFLRLAGLDVDVLKESDFTSPARLKKYDAIVTGIRAANVEKKMAYWLPVLFEYVANGGTLIMQYNTLQDLATTRLGPYPFTLANLRVTEENAPVAFVDPKARLLNYPNKINDSDFVGWVQERGLYFASKWDEHYKPLFEMHDTGEQPLMGSTLYAKYGKGNYIYTTLSFSRQLPAGNKGAIRLLMNMLSAGK